jgi:hypothetical protein
MRETQRTICDWADNTFGFTTPNSAINRMLQEVREVEWHKPDELADECADVLITLYRVADTFNFDLHACVDHKMEINRGRKWKSNGDGTGQHIKETK